MFNVIYDTSSEYVRPLAFGAAIVGCAERSGLAPGTVDRPGKRT